jgi:predicted nucleic acid-binding protein
MAAAEIIYIPVIVLGELDAAFRVGRRTADNRAKLDELLTEEFVRVLPVTADVARRYGELFAELRRAGKPIPVNDIWIAATTLDANAHLLTFATDFDRIDRLDCTVLR